MYSANDRVQTEYKKAKNHLKKCYISAENKNATIPEKKNLENLPDCIDSIISKYGALLSNIRIENAPIKTSYIEGEIVDTSGLKVLAVYDNGATRDITDSIKCTPAHGDIIKLTDTNILIEFKEGNIDVQAKENLSVAKYVRILQSIEVTDPPKKSIYLAGNTLDLTGITVTATYGRGEKVDVTSQCSFSPAEKTNLTVEDNKISISYTENGITKSTQIAITVETSIRKLTDINIVSQPLKTNYYTSEYFNSEGLKVVATFEDGTSEDVTGYCSFNPAYFERADVSEVVVSYSENSVTKSKSIPVTITENVIENIAIVELPKTEYFVGQAFDSEGLKVVANYTSGKQVDITSECSFSKLEALTIEDEVIVISYLEFAAELPIKVSRVEMSSIEVTKIPVKIIYYEGESIDTSGIEVTAHFNNGSTMVLSEGFSYLPEVVTVSDSAVTITYQGLKTTYKITVLEPVIYKIEITTPPTKTAYFRGDTIDTTGLVVTGTYTNGTTEEITSQCTFTPETMSLDDEFIEVYYKEFSARIPVTVTNFAPVSIVVTQNPTKTVYVVGENLDLNGLMVKVTFNDSTVTQLLNGEGLSISKIENLQTSDSLINLSYTLNGITVTTSLQIAVYEAYPTLNDNSWEMIHMMSENGSAKNIWKVGDTKNVTINGVQYQCRIIGFDHDDLVTASASGRTKAGITFEMTTALPTGYTRQAWDDYKKWSETTMYKTNLPAVFETIESELKSYIKEVKKSTGHITRSTTTITTTLTTDNHKLFLLSVKEMKTNYTAYEMVAGEGTIYDYYMAGNSLAKGSEVLTRTIGYGTVFKKDHYLLSVDSNGNITKNTSDSATFKIAVAFCV